MSLAASSSRRTYERRFFPPLPQRLVSLDAYRGFVMLAMMSGGLGLAETAKAFTGNPFWEGASFHSTHVKWEGCSFWDLIQPCFMFLVGVSLAIAGGNHKAERTPYGSLLAKALIRSIVLIALGVAFASIGKSQTNFLFTNVLAQIGLGYFFLFLLWRQSFVTLFLAAFSILMCYWCYFFFYPLPTPDDYAAVNVPSDWLRLQGNRAHWDLNTNAAAAFDRWFLNLFPRSEPFVSEKNGYCTLNFVPSLATMIFGLIAGEWIRSDHSIQRRNVTLLVVGLFGIAIGYALHESGACPLVKKIWSPSWTLYSAGWSAVLLSLFFTLFEVLSMEPIARPLVMIGRNSLAVYCLSQMFRGSIGNFFNTHFGAPLFKHLAEIAGFLPEKIAEAWRVSPPENCFALFGVYAPIAKGVVITLLFWGAAWWMHRRKLYLKI